MVNHRFFQIDYHFIYKQIQFSFYEMLTLKLIKTISPARKCNSRKIKIIYLLTSQNY